MNLVTDRTSVDVVRKKQLAAIGYDNMTADEKAEWDALLKGAYTYADLNRVGAACIEVHDALIAAGYGVPGYTELRTDWSRGDLITPANMQTYLDTVAALKAVLTTVTPIPSDPNGLNWEDANNIERLLLEIEDILERLTAIYPRSGLYHSGAVRYVLDGGKRYQRVEYLISTKGITITGTKLNKESEIRARVYRPSSATAQYIYQADSGSSLSTNFTAYTSSGNNSTGYWRFGNTYASILVPTGEWHETKQNKEGVWIDGTKKATYSSVNAFTTTNNLTIHGTAASANMRIGWVERWESGVLVARYLPVHDLVDDVYGYVDTSDGTFYTNAEAVITAGGEI